MYARHHGEIDSDDLYGLPLDRFVPERAALARTLRAGGRRDEAAAVAGLRKPSIAAWAVNQLVRTQCRDVEALFESGDELRAAQGDLLAGRGAGHELRNAGERQRAAVERLVQVARGLPTSRGEELSAAVLERVADTLQAAALDEVAREQVRAGRLERELRHAGLGLGEGAAAPPAPPAATGAARPRKAASEQTAPAQRDRAAQRRAKDEPAQRDRAAQRRAKDEPAQRDRAAQRHAKDEPAQRDRAAQRHAEAERARREAERARRERAAALTAARATEAAARRRAESATHAVRAAEERREQAAQALREADAALATAREEATTAHAALRRAQGDLEDA